MRELQQHASKWLRLVKEGQTIQITQRGEPVARISPIYDDKRPRTYQDLVDQGIIIPARNRGPKWRDLPKPIKAPPGTPSSQAILDDLRADRL